MDRELKEFFAILDGFRKLNLFDVVPNICHGDWCVLNVAMMQGSLPEKEGKTKVSSIVKEMQIPASAVSRALRSLEEKGLVSRMVDSKDRRNTYVIVTEAGRTLCGDTNDILNDFATSVFTRMGKEDMRDFNQNLKKFQQVLAEEIEIHKCR